MSLNIDFIQNFYCAFDTPIPVALKSNETIIITPVLLSNYFIFVSSYDILSIDKNSFPDPEVISMSYLKFLYYKVFSQEDEDAKRRLQQLLNICLLCLGMNNPMLLLEENGSPFLCDYNIESKTINSKITAKEFEDIRRIILYQNIKDYDDKYINPELKEAMEEQERLQSRNIAPISLERKMAIITTHTGIPKSEQIKMTIREHSCLFQEVCGEVVYSAVKGVSCFGGHGDEVEWLYPRKSNLFDKYATSVEEYNKAMGGSGYVPSVVV